MKSGKAAIYGVAVFLIFFGACSLIYAQMKGPADFTYTGKTQGDVIFKHSTHTETGKLACTECHTAIFKMKKETSGMTTMEPMDKGEFCGKCHDGTKSFDLKSKDNCAKCHQPKAEK